jgi:acetolactate synthase-1/2/3 large subunit
MKAGHAIVEVLKAEGVKFVFGLPGGHTLPIYDAIRDCSEIRHVLVRHEQCAANMAAAYAALTGEPGVCCATAGPGATNLVTGIAEAFVGALPVIAITGRAGTRTAQRGACQEVPQERVFAPITKQVIQVGRADLVVEAMRHSFTVARSGKPGPVLVVIPRDILTQEMNFDGYVPVRKPPAPRGDPGLVSAAVNELLKANRPIVITGGGALASGAFTELREFAETVGLPVLTTLSGRGSFPDDHPLAAGGLGMHRTDISKKLLGEADFVLGLGCRFEEFETNWAPGYVPAPDACYVQVDVDPTEIGKSIVPRIGIVSDVKSVLQDMMEVMRNNGGPNHRTVFHDLPRIKSLSRSREELEAEIDRIARSDEVPLNPLRIVREVRRVFPPETTVAIDIGNLSQAWGGAFPYFKIFEPRSVIACTSFYAMGYASSALPVAKLVYPQRPAVGLCGDGSFQMIMNILPVAAEYGLPVTWCILNDSSLGSIKDVQTENFAGRTIGTSFGVQPDFAAIANACKCHGEKVEDPSQIRPAIERAVEANKQGLPSVLDFIVHRETPKATREFRAAAIKQ